MKTLTINEPFVLESGKILPFLDIAYHTFGQLNADATNVVWVFHALTGNANPVEWWPGLVGEGEVIDTEKDFIICANVLGSCYGTSGPTSINPETGQKFAQDFSFVTIRDIVKAHQVLQKHLGILKIKLGIGGSLGGQQLLEWSIQSPSLFENICLLATNAKFSAWGIAFNESQRMAIHADLKHGDQGENRGKNGLKTARSIALLSYRTYHAYGQSQKEDSDNILNNFKASSYQQYQGEKLWSRFDVFSYLRLTTAMDSHNVGRNRESIPKALSRISAKTLIIGIHSDILFPIEEQKFMFDHINKAQFEIIDSPFGHDGFLVEAKKISNLLSSFLKGRPSIPSAGQENNFQSTKRSFLKRPIGWALPGSESF